jgi:hypothetical protein
MKSFDVSVHLIGRNLCLEPNSMVRLTDQNHIFDGRLISEGLSSED